MQLFLKQTETDPSADMGALGQCINGNRLPVVLMDIDHQRLDACIQPRILRFFLQFRPCQGKERQPNLCQRLPQRKLVAPGPVINGKSRLDLLQDSILLWVLREKREQLQGRGCERENILPLQTAPGSACQKYRIKQMNQLHIGPCGRGDLRGVQHIGIHNAAGARRKHPFSIGRTVFHAPTFYIKQFSHPVPMPWCALGQKAVQFRMSSYVRKVLRKGRNNFLFILGLHFKFIQVHHCHSGPPFLYTIIGQKRIFARGDMEFPKRMAFPFHGGILLTKWENYDRIPSG